MMYEHLRVIERVRIERGGPAVIAHTDWPLSLILDSYSMTLAKQCCPDLQRGVEESEDPQFKHGETVCGACGALNKLNTACAFDWRDVSTGRLCATLEYAGLNHLEATLYADSLALDFARWLRSRKLSITSFYYMGQLMRDLDQMEPAL